MFEQDRIARLNAPTPRERLEALRALTEARHAAGRERPAPGRDVNNHIHTTYSFSPYSPAKAVWMAAEAGLATAGLMDHDSIGGAREFIEAGRILGLPTTIGAECRASFAATPLAGRRINNPDQETIAYVALHYGLLLPGQAPVAVAVGMLFIALEWVSAFISCRRVFNSSVQRQGI